MARSPRLLSLGLSESLEGIVFVPALRDLILNQLVVPPNSPAGKTKMLYNSALIFVVTSFDG